MMEDICVENQQSAEERKEAQALHDEQVQCEADAKREEARQAMTAACGG